MLHPWAYHIDRPKNSNYYDIDLFLQAICELNYTRATTCKENCSKLDIIFRVNEDCTIDEYETLDINRDYNPRSVDEHFNWCCVYSKTTISDGLLIETFTNDTSEYGIIASPIKYKYKTEGRGFHITNYEPENKLFEIKMYEPDIKKRISYIIYLIHWLTE